MGYLIFDFWGKSRKRTFICWDIKNRVIAKAIISLRLTGNFSVAFSLYYPMLTIRQDTGYRTDKLCVSLYPAGWSALGSTGRMRRRNYPSAGGK